MDMDSCEACKALHAECSKNKDSRACKTLEKLRNMTKREESTEGREHGKELRKSSKYVNDLG